MPFIVVDRTDLDHLTYFYASTANTPVEALRETGLLDLPDANYRCEGEYEIDLVAHPITVKAQIIDVDFMRPHTIETYMNRLVKQGHHITAIRFIRYAWNCTLRTAKYYVDERRGI